MKSLLRLLRLEEFLYLLFFAGLLLVSLMKGEWFFRLYADRFTYFFGILFLLLISWRIHLRLWAAADVQWGALREEVNWVLQVSRDIVNLYMCLVMYSSLASFLKHFPIKDEAIVHFERWLFGGNPLLWLEPLIAPWLTKIMVVAYLAFFLYLPVLTLHLLTQGKTAEMRQFMASLSIALVIGYSGYMLVPAVGPAVFQAGDFHVSLWKENPGAYREALQAVIDDQRLAKDCFPSMHVCLSMLALIFAFRFSRGLFFAFTPGILCLIASTMYLRYHYVTDVVAGIALAAFAAAVGPVVLRRWPGQNE